MRVLLSSNHRYPGDHRHGTGRQPREWPSGSGFIIHDLIAKGLAELGHEVFYRLPRGADEPLPAGAVLVHEPVADVDVLHTMTFRDHELVSLFQRMGTPCVASCHLDPTVPGRTINEPIQDNWIFVSRTLAQSLHRSRFVVNGLDPEDFIYADTKDDYFLFMANLDWAAAKGLFLALHLAKRLGFRFVVAGTAKTAEVVARMERLCLEAGAEYVGDIRGQERARLLARARGVLFPTQVNEAFGLVMAEGLMSGTPVIASSYGSCPEIVSPDVGFICETEKDYVDAIERIGEISPFACRERAVTNFHYLRMTRDYLREYDAEIAAVPQRLSVGSLAPIAGQN
jgi:glycosyltransferase involved in cell wall biosynthesis